MSFSIAFLTLLCIFYTSGAEQCGVPKINMGRIMGGKIAPDGAWPWMVSLNMWTEKNVPSMCSGFLIDRLHVLTAAHCFDEYRNPILFYARVGSVDVNKAKPHYIESITVHDKYKKGIFEYDIAILKLNPAVTLDTVTPICLPTGALSGRDFEGVAASLAGWGAASFDGPAENLLYQLREIPIISNNVCNEIFSSDIFRKPLPSGITDRHICAGFLEGGKDGCRGDSGAPLMYELDGSWYAIGLTSFGYQCGLKGYPGGYTRITKYLSWIFRVHRG